MLLLTINLYIDSFGYNYRKKEFVKEGLVYTCLGFVLKCCDLREDNKQGTYG